MAKSADHVGVEGDHGEQRQEVTNKDAFVLAQKPEAQRGAKARKSREARRAIRRGGTEWHARTGHPTVTSGMAPQAGHDRGPYQRTDRGLAHKR